MRAEILSFCLLAVLACEPREPRDHAKHEAEAVLESSPEKGFRLAPQALRTLGIETISLKRGTVEEIPASALVYFQDEIGVYRLRDGWFRLIPLDHPEELQAGDTVVNRGAAFLRVTDMSLFGDQPSGHHH